MIEREMGNRGSKSVALSVLLVAYQSASLVWGSKRRNKEVVQL
jgi:hypothetical protein